MRWDSKSRRYVDSDGSVLSPSKVRKEVIDYIESERSRVQGEASKLLSGTTSLSAFFTFMQSKVEAWHLVAGSIAYGGKSQMDKERRARIATKVKSEKEYLAKFRNEVEQSFAAAREIASQVAESIEQPIKSLDSEKKGKVRRAVTRALINSAPSEAEEIARKAVSEALEGEVLTSAIKINKSLASKLIGKTVESRAAMYAEATYSTFQNNVMAREFDSGVRLGRRICLDDPASCEECVEAATEEFVSLDELPEIGSLQCMSNCVVAGTLMGGRFNGGLKALYTGEIVNLRTASGRKLTITPNHPVLTDRGFVPAGHLGKGQNLISQGGDINAASAVYDHQQPPTAIEEILTALGKFGLRARVRAGAVDLNGDERAFNGDVEIVSTYGILRDSVQSARSQGCRDFVFPSTLKDESSSLSFSSSSKNAFGDRFSAYGIPRGGGLGLSSLQSFLPRQALGFASVSDGNPSFNESGFNRLAANAVDRLQFQHTGPLFVLNNGCVDVHSSRSEVFAVSTGKDLAFGQCANMNIALRKPAAEDVGADAEFLSQIWERFPGLVASDPVVEVFRTTVTNLHVYDLSTNVGWQSANGLIIANCRCEFEFSIEGIEFSVSDVFEGVITGQDAYGGSVTVN